MKSLFTIFFLCSLYCLSAQVVLDRNFGINGTAIVEREIGFSTRALISASKNNEIYFSGYTNDLNGRHSAFISRITDEGLIDSTFAPDGFLIKERPVGIHNSAYRHTGGLIYQYNIDERIKLKSIESYEDETLFFKKTIL